MMMLVNGPINTPVQSLMSMHGRRSYAFILSKLLAVLCSRPSLASKGMRLTPIWGVCVTVCSSCHSRSLLRGSPWFMQRVSAPEIGYRSCATARCLAVFLFDRRPTHVQVAWLWMDVKEWRPMFEKKGGWKIRCLKKVSGQEMPELSSFFLRGGAVFHEIYFDGCPFQKPWKVADGDW